MKVKQRPEDFRVEEVSRLEPGSDGPFVLYRLEKSGIGTPEALRVVTRRWRLRREDVAFAGLKDRYGLTGQMVSVRRGPQKNFDGRGFKLNYLGRSHAPAARGTIAANGFRIVVRDLSEDEAARVGARARAAAEHGWPDYFDDQRFGSLRGTGGRFVAHALLAGDAEEALRLAVACPAREDRSRTRARRTRMRDRWGRWAELAGTLDKSVELRVCRRLVGGASFAEAYEELDPAVRALHLGALQAHLYNEGLRQAVGAGGPRHPGTAGPYVFFRGDPGALAEERIPLAAGDAPDHPLLDAVLEEAGLRRAELARLPFRGATRGAVVVPSELVCGEPGPDELNRGRSCVELSFSLRSGSYATMLVKRCTYDM